MMGQSPGCGLQYDGVLRFEGIHSLIGHAGLARQTGSGEVNPASHHGKRAKHYSTTLKAKLSLGWDHKA